MAHSLANTTRPSDIYGQAHFTLAKAYMSAVGDSGAPSLEILDLFREEGSGGRKRNPKGLSGKSGRFVKRKRSYQRAKLFRENVTNKSGVGIAFKTWHTLGQVHQTWGSSKRGQAWSVLSGSELIGEARTPGTPGIGQELFSQDISPMSFPNSRLIRIAALFQKYKFMKVRFTYVPSRSAMTDGQFLHYVEYDPLDSLQAVAGTFEYVQLAAQHRGARPMQVWQKSVCNFYDGDGTASSYYINPAAGSDPRLMSQGKYILTDASSLPANTSYGLIYMDYVIKFYDMANTVPESLNSHVPIDSRLKNLVITTGGTEKSDNIMYISEVLKFPSGDCHPIIQADYRDGTGVFPALGDACPFGLNTQLVFHYDSSAAVDQRSRIYFPKGDFILITTMTNTDTTNFAFNNAYDYTGLVAWDNVYVSQNKTSNVSGQSFTAQVLALSTQNNFINCVRCQPIRQAAVAAKNAVTSIILAFEFGQLQEAIDMNRLKGLLGSGVDQDFIRKVLKTGTVARMRPSEELPTPSRPISQVVSAMPPLSNWAATAETESNRIDAKYGSVPQVVDADSERRRLLNELAKLREGTDCFVPHVTSKTPSRSKQNPEKTE